MSRVKTFTRSGCFAWNPEATGLVCGTTANQFDASFSSNSNIEYCEIDLGDPNVELQPKSTVGVDHRFHSLHWSPFLRPSSPNKGSGLLIGGCDNGIITMYDVVKQDTGGVTFCPLLTTQKHTGHVCSIDSNIFQRKLLVSGAGMSEVFIWDLNNPQEPMMPGPKQQPPDQIQHVEWSPQVEHILGSLSSSKALVWDLRRGDGPILTLGDIGSRADWKTFHWHPSSATTMMLANADDHYPILQSWDVRYANAPVNSLEGHSKGIMSMDWCKADPDLLVSCSKDMKMYLWNPNKAQFIAEMQYSGRGIVNDVIWCPSNPNLIGCSSSDGRISVYSLVETNEHQSGSSLSPLPSPKLAESFPGADFTAPAPVKTGSAPNQFAPFHLGQVPKWHRPGSCGARFAFGGKLITHEEAESEDGRRFVDIKQVTSEPALQRSASEFESVLSDGGVSEYCEKMSKECPNANDRIMWKFMQTHATNANRKEFIKILGIDLESSMNHLVNLLGPEEEWLVNTPNYEDDHSSSTNSNQTRSSGDQEQLEQSNSSSSWVSSGFNAPITLPFDMNSESGQLMSSIISGELGLAVELCARKKDWPNAFLLAASGGLSMFKAVQKLYSLEMSEAGDSVSQIISYIGAKKWDEIVDCMDVSQWKQIMAILFNFVPSDVLSPLLAKLSLRMHNGSTEQQFSAAIPCLGARDVDGVVYACQGVSSVQIAVHLSTLLRQLNGAGSLRVGGGGQLYSEAITQYAQSLVDQGLNNLAFKLIDSIEEKNMNEILYVLKDRLAEHCDQNRATQRSGRPFKTVRVMTKDKNKVIQGSNFNSGYISNMATAQYSSGIAPPVSGYATPTPGIGPPVPGIGPPVSTYGYNQSFQQNAQSYQQPAPPLGYRPAQQMMPAPPQQREMPPPAPPPKTDMPILSHAIDSQTIIFFDVKHNRSRYPSYSSDGISYPSREGGQHTGTGHWANVQQPNYAMPPPPNQENNWNTPTMAGGKPAAAIIPRTVERPKQSWNDPPPMAPRKPPTSAANVPAPVSMNVLGGVPSSYQPTGINGAVGQMGPNFQQQIEKPKAPPVTAAEEVPQIELPNEFKPIQQALENLAKTCLARNPNPVMKRRVGESQKKIDKELVYRLAVNKLSPDSVNILNHIAQYILSGDFNSALAMQAHLAQGYDFSETSTFSPAIKALIQTAIQMKV